jgi:putative restriction endonuclease
MLPAPSIDRSRYAPAVDGDADARVRAAALAYLDRLGRATGGLVARSELEAFDFEGRRLPLIAVQRGIWKPRQMDAALSILTTYSPNPERRPYEDDLGADGFPRYKWRGTDPNFYDNVAVRVAMETRRPLIWFVGVAPALFDPRYPVWIAGEEPSQHQFVLALDEDLLAWHPDLAALPHDPVRRLAERVVRVRLHQPVFRRRVIVAYERRCALCRLRHVELLEAAHIKRDAQGGQPILPNGISMCALHHRAFDANILGIDPRYRIAIRPDILTEPDGPTLTYALQGLHGGAMSLPRRRAERPHPELLEERYEEFLAAG